MGLLSPGLKNLFLVLSLSLSAAAATHHVQVGDIFFKDIDSNTTNPAITTINAGDTVEWDWVPTGGTHTTTSGACQGEGCSPDGLWDAPVTQASPVFSRTFNTAGTFTYYCTPHLAEMQGTVIVINPADFTISFSDANGGNVGGPIFPSQQTVFDGSIAASNGFNSPVSLTCQPGSTPLPSPCTPSPANGTLPFSFTVTAGASTPGHYSFSVQGVGGMLTHTFPNLNFDVVDFNIAAPSPSAVTAFYEPASTSSTSTTVTLTAAGSLPDLVTLMCDNNTLPAGAACIFTPPGQPIGQYGPAPGAPVTVTVSITVPAATTAKDYNVILNATSDTNAGSVTRTQSLPLHVVQFAPSAFMPTAVTIGAGNVSNSATTNLSASQNFAGTVSLSCTAGLPAGGACNFSPGNGVAGSFPSSQSVTISVPFNTPPASPTLTIAATGNSGGAAFAQNQSLTLNIPAPTLSLAPISGTPVSMVDNSFSAPISVQITPTNLAGTVTLSCGNLPAGVACQFLPSATVNVNGEPATVELILEASAATPSTYSNITLNASATINAGFVMSSASLGPVTISAPTATTDITLHVSAVNALSNTPLINIGDPNLQITASVNNSGSTYSSAVWEVSFSSPVILVPASNASCSQLLPTVISCNVGDVPINNSSYSFKVAPLFARSLVINNWLTSSSVGASNLANNAATAPTIQIRLRPLARKGLVPKTP